MSQPLEPSPSPWLTASRRAALLTNVLALGLLSGLVLSPKLWLSTRSYPLTPVWDRLPTIPPPFDAVWFGTMLALLIALVFVPWRRWLLVALLTLAVASALFDQSRWQPWFYQYLAMLAALAWAAWKPDDSSRQESALGTCRLVVAATYFWSGVQKINATFVAVVCPWLLEPLPEAVRSLLGWAGYVAPFVEAAVGVGLLWPRLRPPAIAAAVVMHLLLLLALGPTGHNWNSVVWPWNVVMIAAVLVLFVRTPEAPARAILWPRGCLYGRLILLTFGVLPGLHLVGLWDAYLSAALYSGNTIEAYVRIDPERLPADVLPHAERQGGEWRIELTTWSMRELNVPAYPARRVYRHVAEELAGRAVPTGGLELVISSPVNWRSHERRETVTRVRTEDKVPR